MFPKIRLNRLAGYISNPPRSRKSLFVTPKRVPRFISPKESCEGCRRGWFSKFFLSLPSQMFFFLGGGGGEGSCEGCQHIAIQRFVSQTWNGHFFRCQRKRTAKCWSHWVFPIIICCTEGNSSDPIGCFNQSPNWIPNRLPSSIAWNIYKW